MADKLLEEAENEIKQYADAGLIPEEFAEEISTMIKNGRVIFPPDLSIEDQDIPITGEYEVGKPMHVEVKVHNTGYVSARDVKVNVYAEPMGRHEMIKDLLARKEKHLIETFTIDRVSRQGEALFNFDWIPQERGTYFIIVEVECSMDKNTSARSPYPPPNIFL